MKVLQVHNFYRTPGGECSVVNAERALLKHYGHEVVPYYRDSRDIDKLGMLAKVHTLLRVPCNKKVEKDLVSTVHDERPDVAHVHNIFPMLTAAVYKALKSCSVPVVQTVHNFRFLCPNGQFYVHNHICEACQERGYFSAVKNRCMQDSFLVSSVYAIAIARAWKSGVLPNNIDRFITLNKFFARRLIDAGVPSSRIQILGNYVSEISESIYPKQNYVLYLGRLSREKGLRTLLDAWERIDGAVLKIAGRGPLKAEIETIANRIGREKVQVLGHVAGDAKRDLIKSAICLVVPSEWYENFPISIVESMAYGTPVVASQIGGLPDLVKHGVTGLLFEPGNSAELKAVLRTLISDSSLVSRLAESALSAAKESLGSQRHYNGLIDIYHQAINSGK